MKIKVIVSQTNLDNSTSYTYHCKPFDYQNSFNIFGYHSESIFELPKEIDPENQQIVLGSIATALNAESIRKTGSKHDNSFLTRSEIEIEIANCLKRITFLSHPDKVKLRN